MNDSVEARAVAEVMEKKPNVTVTYLPGAIRIDGDPRLEFKMNEIGEALGRPMTPHLFEISTSTHYGRMVMVDDNTVVCFGNMDDALEYIERDLQETSDLLGGSQILGSQIKSELDAHELLHRGLPRAALSKLVDNLHVIQVDEATEALGMSLRTLQRHKNTPVAHLRRAAKRTDLEVRRDPGQGDPRARFARRGGTVAQDARRSGLIGSAPSIF